MIKHMFSSGFCGIMCVWGYFGSLWGRLTGLGCIKDSFQYESIL